MWWAGLITVLLLFEFPKTFTCSTATLRKEFTSLTSISTSPRLSDTTFFTYAGYSTYPGPSGSQNIWWNGNVLLKSLLISFSHSEWLCKSDCKTKMNMTFRERLKKKGNWKGDLSPKQSLLCLGTVGHKRFGLPIREEGRGGEGPTGPSCLKTDWHKPGLNFNLCIFFSCSKAFSGEKILYSFFRASNHQIVNKKN